VSARKPRRKQGGKDQAGKEFPSWGCDGTYFELPHTLIQSAAFRSLRTKAVAALVYLLAGWRPGDTYALPRRKCLLHHGTRAKALAEIVEAGIMDCVDPGGLCPVRAAIYKPSRRWRARSAALMADETAGKAQGKLGLWTPTRTRKAAPPGLFKKGKASKARPTKRAVVEKAQAVVRGKKRARRNSGIEGRIN
jgi:hypothetical protein